MPFLFKICFGRNGHHIATLCYLFEFNLSHLLKFRIELPVLQLGREFQAPGMKTAFDISDGTANFDDIAPGNENDYLMISEIFHKTFLDQDEDGTEAAAATAVIMVFGAAGSFTQPEQVFVDRPFFFAIQHRKSGACLFMGQLADPRGDGSMFENSV
jgi:serine protease inhibitor